MINKTKKASSKTLLIAINYLPNFIVILFIVSLILFPLRVIFLDLAIIGILVIIIFIAILAYVLYKLALVTINDFKAEKQYFIKNPNSSVNIEVFPNYYYRGTLDKYIKIRAVSIISFVVFLTALFVLLGQFEFKGIYETLLLVIIGFLYIVLSIFNAFYLSANRIQSSFKTFLIIILFTIPIGYIIVLLTPKYPKVIKKRSKWSKIAGIVLFSIGILSIIISLFAVFTQKASSPDYSSYSSNNANSEFDTFLTYLQILYSVGVTLLGKILINESKLISTSIKDETLTE